MNSYEYILNWIHIAGKLILYMYISSEQLFVYLGSRIFSSEQLFIYLGSSIAVSENCAVIHSLTRKCFNQRAIDASMFRCYGRSLIATVAWY